MMAEMNDFKRRAHELVDNLPDTAEWRELANEVAIVQDIEEGLADSNAGLLTENSEVRLQYEGGE
jgi:hypothetical protein